MINGRQRTTCECVPNDAVKTTMTPRILRPYTSDCVETPIVVKDGRAVVFTSFERKTQINNEFEALEDIDGVVDLDPEEDRVLLDHIEMWTKSLRDAHPYAVKHYKYRSRDIWDYPGLKKDHQVMACAYNPTTMIATMMIYTVVSSAKSS